MYTNATTKKVFAGSVAIGGGAPISIQSMLCAHAHDIDGNVAQALALQEAGCDIVRVSVPDVETIKTVEALKQNITIPLVADIHFDYRLAIAAMENGVDKIRFNPGNIGSEDHVRSLVDCAKMHRVPIRIGVNAGSIEKDLKEKYGPASPKGMVESALRHVRILEDAGFYDTVISLKASTVEDTVAAYRMMSGLVSYPLHIGVTETGSVNEGIMKSAIGIGSLLLDGIGDTLRVSLTDDPVREVEVGRQILRCLHLLKDDIEIVSCPTCGRTRVNLMEAVKQVESRLPRNQGYLKVAVMGCAVNGPGEAADADIGIAFGPDNGVIFKKGEKFCSGRMPEILDRLVAEAQAMLSEGA